MKPPIKVLNLYAGIGGNRKLWENVEVTAVEINPKIAAIYKDLFPSDNIIISDAHSFLLKHYDEYDFIWSSPPCVTHSSFAWVSGVSDDIRTGNRIRRAKYPDMRLYQEIIFLENFFNGLWVVENVVSYYTPLIKPKKIQRHYFWNNFYITEKQFPPDNIKNISASETAAKMGLDLSKYDLKGIRQDQLMRNCVNSQLGRHVFNCAFMIKQTKLSESNATNI